MCMYIRICVCMEENGKTGQIFLSHLFLLKRKLRIMISLDEWRKRERAIGGLLFDNQVLSEKCQWLVID